MSMTLYVKRALRIVVVDDIVAWSERKKNC